MALKKSVRPVSKKVRTPVKVKQRYTGTTMVLRSQKREEREREKREEAAAVLRAAQELQEQRDAMLANQAQALPGSLGDKNFHAAFVQMGQGDCTIMATPEGRVVMIDCGSDSTETKDKTVFTLRVASILRNAKFLRHSRLVDALILTHSDTDHYNHLKRVLPQNTKFQNIYHSDKRDTYSEAGTSAFLLSRAVSESRIFAVDHHMNRPAKTPVIRLNGASVKPATGTEKINVLDGNGGIRIVNEPDCKISLLASNVNPPQPQDNSNPKNRGSIVTLVEVFGETLLMCGDATVATEKYVLDRHRARITDVTLAQAGHHGSARTSSSLDYVQCVNPELAIVSAGKAVVKDHLPSYTVIKRYTAQMTRAADIDEHEIFYWRCYGLSDGYGYESDITRRPIHVTGSWMTYYYTIKAPGGGA